MTEYEISVLSPVHIGNGNEYGFMDFVASGERISYINIDKVLDKLIIKGKNTSVLYEEIEHYGKNFKISMFLNKYEIDVNSVTNYYFQCKESPSHIHEFIKNAFFIPLIPGSSIKGAIRTTLAWYLLKDKKNEIETIIKKKLEYINNIQDNKERKKQKKQLGNKLGGEIENLIFYGNKNDAQFDLFKSMTVTDVSFESIDSLNIEKCKVLSTTKYSSLRPKHNIFLETLKIHEKSIKMEISLNTYFLEKKYKELGFDKNKINSIKEFPNACNEFSKAIIEYELSFFEQYNLPELTSFYKNLYNIIPDTNNEFLLQIGYGVGWLSTTLGLLLKNNEQLLMKLRKTFSMGRRKKYPHYLDEFPKTRRIIANKNLKYPMGWIKLRKIS